VIAFTGTLSFGCGDRRPQKILSRKRFLPRSGLLIIFVANRPNEAGCLKNKICDYFRKLGRETCFTDLEFLDDELSHKFVPQGFWNHEAGPLEWKPEAEVVMHRTEFWETFRDCLAKLPQRVADVFMLREMEEMETSQICEALNISPNNLWVMLHRARMALRECLEINWFKEPQPEGHL